MVYTAKRRDYVAHFLANLALRIASRPYRQMIKGAVIYGMDSAARDEREGNDPPPHWQDYRAEALETTS